MLKWVYLIIKLAERSRLVGYQKISISEMVQKLREEEGIEVTAEKLSSLLDPIWSESDSRLRGEKVQSELIAPDLLVRSDGSFVMLDEQMAGRSLKIAKIHKQKFSNVIAKMLWSDYVTALKTLF